jgi:predicted nuclease of predicted toxin-antitoxin system
MKLLLDENLPHRLRPLLADHEVYTVPFMGWRGLGNGRLLSRAGENAFDVLLSMDAGLEHQQDLARLPCALLLIRAPSNSLADLRPLVPAILKALEGMRPKTLLRVD